MIRPPVVLASASPRRIELLRGAGVEFTVVPADAEESHDAQSGLAALVTQNARAKASAVAAHHPEAVVIGADTLVWLDNVPLGKPAGNDEARRMLKKLSGRVHEVATGVHMIRASTRTRIEFHETSHVRFRELREEDITNYLRSVPVLDKAGAYALQECGEILIEAVEGCRSNVIGLPVERTVGALRRHFGW